MTLRFLNPTPPGRDPLDRGLVQHPAHALRHRLPDSCT